MATAEAPGFHPLYIQVKNLLIKRLVSGDWRPGQVLPSEIKLADEFNVSQGTVRKALDEMASINLVVRRQGKGTYVAAHTPHRALFHFFHLVGEDGSRVLPESRVLGTRYRGATRKAAERLSLAPGAPVVIFDRVRSLNGRPTVFETIVVAESMFPGLGRPPRDALPNTVYEYFEQEYGVTIVNAVERVRAAAAGKREARLLDLAPGAPLLVIDRVAFGLERLPVEWRLSRCDTSRHHYLSEIE